MATFQRYKNVLEPFKAQQHHKAKIEAIIDRTQTVLNFMAMYYHLDPNTISDIDLNELLNKIQNGHGSQELAAVINELRSITKQLTKPTQAPVVQNAGTVTEVSKWGEQFLAKAKNSVSFATKESMQVAQSIGAKVSDALHSAEQMQRQMIAETDYKSKQEDLKSCLEHLSQHAPLLHTTFAMALEHDFIAQAGYELNGEKDQAIVIKKASDLIQVQIELIKAKYKSFINAQMQEAKDKIKKTYPKAYEYYQGVLNDNKRKIDEETFQKINDSFKKLIKPDELEELKYSELNNSFEQLKAFAKFVKKELLEQLEQDIKKVQVIKDNFAFDLFLTGHSNLSAELDKFVLPTREELGALKPHELSAKFDDVLLSKLALMKFINENTKQMAVIKNAALIAIDPSEIDKQISYASSEYIDPNEPLKNAINYLFDNVQELDENTALTNVIYSLKYDAKLTQEQLYTILTNTENRNVLMKIESYSLSQADKKALYLSAGSFNDIGKLFTKANAIIYLKQKIASEQTLGNEAFALWSDELFDMLKAPMLADEEGLKLARAINSIVKNRTLFTPAFLVSLVKPMPTEALSGQQAIEDNTDKLLSLLQDYPQHSKSIQGILSAIYTEKMPPNYICKLPPNNNFWVTETTFLAKGYELTEYSEASIGGLPTRAQLLFQSQIGLELDAILYHLEQDPNRLMQISNTLKTIDAVIEDERKILNLEWDKDQKKYLQLKALKKELHQLLLDKNTDFNTIVPTISKLVDNKLSPTGQDRLHRALEIIWQALLYINPFTASDKNPEYARFFKTTESSIKNIKKALVEPVYADENSHPNMQQTMPLLMSARDN